jgi:hypothetical protein
MKNIVWISGVLFAVVALSGEKGDAIYSCTFPAYATEKGLLHDDVLKFTITTDDYNETHTRTQDNGSATGKIIRAEKGISFIEVSPLGNIATTTIASVPPIEEAQKAVHSKNILREGKLVARQYYGTCRTVDKVLTQKIRFAVSKERQQKIYKELHIETKLKTLPKKDVK